MMIGYRFYFPDYHNFGNCWVWSRSKPPSINREVVSFPDNIAAVFLNNYRLHTVVTNSDGAIIETNERIC